LWGNNANYQRQPKDDKFFDPIEGHQCGSIYEKVESSREKMQYVLEEKTGEQFLILAVTLSERFR